MLINISAIINIQAIYFIEIIKEKSRKSVSVEESCKSYWSQFKDYKLFQKTKFNH